MARLSRVFAQAHGTESQSGFRVRLRRRRMKENMHHRVARFREQQVTSCCPYSIVCSPRHRFRNKTHSCPCTGLVCCPAVLNFLSLSFREKRFYQQRYSFRSPHKRGPLSPLHRPRACFVTFLEPTDTANLHSTSNHHPHHTHHTLQIHHPHHPWLFKHLINLACQPDR